MELHLKLLVEFGVHVQPDEYGLCEACSGHRGCRAVTGAGPPGSKPSPRPLTPPTPILLPQLTHPPGRTPPAFWAAWQRTGPSVGPQEDG